MVQKANSGHPGAPMGCAPMTDALFRRGLMKYDPAQPKWIARDRFVLSNGHGCALLYSMLHLTGYAKPTMDDLKAFRQLDSCTPGHPECTELPGAEVTTGPLGQGIANAVGLAIAEKHLAAVFNEPDAPALIDNYTFVICGDGCLQEGVSGEASSLAGHLKLNKLILLYDDNHITIDGDTEVSFTEDVLKRYEAYGWSTMVVANGDSDYDGLLNAVALAKQSADKPTIIKVRTTIGFGATKQGTEGVHGSPLGAADVIQVKKRFGFPEDQSFYVPPEALAQFREAGARGAADRAEWEAGAQAYKAKHAAKWAEFDRRVQGKLPAGWEVCCGRAGGRVRTAKD
jgi:transketolase